MAMQDFRIENTLKTLIEGHKYSAVKEILLTMNPSDIATVFDEVDEKELLVLFRLLNKDAAAETFIEMDPEIQELLIRGFSDKELQQVIDRLYVDDAVDIVEEMPANVVSRILGQAKPEMRKNINDILRYPENSAGSIMTVEYVYVTPETTIREAFDKIRDYGVNKETIYTVYVTKNRHLEGLVSAKDLLLAKDQEMPVSTLMEDNPIFVNTHTDQEEVARMFSKYNFLALPVVDNEGRLVGIVTFDDAMDVMEEETTEDFEKLSGVTPTDQTYLRSSPFRLFLHRIPWLLILMISATFTGMIISHFENALAVQVVLVAFIPMLMGTGGNSGSQSSVTVIRALSLGEIGYEDTFRVLFKETMTSILCGVVLGVACFGKLILVERILLGNSDITITVALVVSLSMIVTVIMAKVMGCLLPLLAKRLGCDPAVMSSPFLTTIVDALSLLIYLGIASYVLKI